MYRCGLCLNMYYIYKNIFTIIYFLYVCRADHDDQEVIVFNRCMLPAYYGLLRLCCQQSRTFTRQLAGHQNIQWAFKNITPYTTQYNAVSDAFTLFAYFIKCQNSKFLAVISYIKSYVIY